MPKASVKRLIESNKDQLIDLVLDIEKYPDFIPYCLNSKVYKRKNEGNTIFIIADLTIGKGPFKDTYKSDVRYNKKENSIFVKNMEGPLKYLDNKWNFNKSGKFTEVSFEVDFELKNRVLNLVMIKSFKYALNKIVDAFQKRAEDLFSKS